MRGTFQEGLSSQQERPRARLNIINESNQTKDTEEALTDANSTRFENESQVRPEKELTSKQKKIVDVTKGRTKQGTIDINLPEYQYLADHLTERECHQLVTALHFKEFKLPKRLDDAEQKLPKDVSCINLLLHWNSLPRGGKGETHVEISHRLTQIGRQDLAVWLTETVFHQLSNDLKNSLTSPRTRKSARKFCTTENYPDDAIFIDEAAWWKLDTFLSTVLVLGMTTCFVGAIFLCYLCLTRNQNYN